MPHDEFPFRVYMPDGRVISIKRIGPSQVCAEYPDFNCIQRADRPQPPPFIEDENDA